MTTEISGEELRERMRAVLKDCVARHSKSEKQVCAGYSFDSAKEKRCYRPVGATPVLSSEINNVTPAHRFSANANRDSRGENESGGATCSVSIIELPAAARYRKTLAVLQTKPPELIPVERWRQCVEDGKRFLAKWGTQAEALGWTSADLFGLHQPPEQPHPSYRRLSRYDCTGLVWLLEGRPVVALTADTASIRHPTGGITTYRKHNKPALGPAGDDIFDIDPGWRQ